MPATQEERQASLEIILSSYKLVVSRIPLLPFKWKWGLYKSYIENLSSKALLMYYQQSILAMPFYKGQSMKYKSTTSQVDDIIKEVPVIGKHRGFLTTCVKAHRIKSGLEK